MFYVFTQSHHFHTVVEFNKCVPAISVSVCCSSVCLSAIELVSVVLMWLEWTKPWGQSCNCQSSSFFPSHRNSSPVLGGMISSCVLISHVAFSLLNLRALAVQLVLLWLAEYTDRTKLLSRLPLLYCIYSSETRANPGSHVQSTKGLGEKLKMKWKQILALSHPTFSWNQVLDV